VDALELLKIDHDKVRDLFSKFKDAKESDDTGTMQSLQSEIFQELEVHTSVEEEVFYPAAEDAGEEAEELVKEGVEEHHVVEVLMGEIRGLSPDDDAWAAKMTVLIENVEHHAEEEEEELFPKLRKVFGDSKLEELGQQLEQAKARRGVVQPSGDALAEEASRDALYEKAKELDIDGRSSMTKDELAEAVAKRQ
jgi:hemerythrin superfamily protein